MKFHFAWLSVIASILIISGFTGSQIAFGGIQTGDAGTNMGLDMVGSAQVPIVITRDVNGPNDLPLNLDPVLVNACDPPSGCPPIYKAFDFNSFQNPTGPPGVGQGQSIVLHEEWVVGANGVPWTDWHEELHTEGWLIDTIEIEIKDPTGATVFGPADIGPGPIDPTDKIAWFFLAPFNNGQPLTAGYTLIIWKTLDPDPNTPNLFPFTGIIELWEYPSIDTKKKMVGGQMINVDSTALILAGGQMTAAWILPVLVAGAGFAIVIARKF